MLQKELKVMDEINVFIEFDIIQKSNPTNLYKELDLLIVAGKQIHLWSKTKSPAEMEKYCLTKEIFPEEYDKNIHRKAWDMRRKESKTYQDIADTLKTTVKLVSFYIKTDPDLNWRLADWIVGYHKKDSSVYDKIDYLVDNDLKLVQKFKRFKRSANYVEKI
jgi:hypothetical protein